MNKPATTFQSVLFVVCALWPSAALAQTTPAATGVGVGTFNAATTYSGVPLSGQHWPRHADARLDEAGARIG